MKRIRKFWREAIRPWWYDYEWWVIGGLALAVMVLGCIGFRLQLLDENKPVELVDLVFKSFQLFVLQISVEPPMPWQLNAARVLAPLIAGYTALQALGQLLAEEFQSFRLRFLHRHVVICGLGRKGLLLAREFLNRGQAVVVIEQDAENDFVRQCRDLGAAVLLGDAAESDLLREIAARLQVRYPSFQKLFDLAAMDMDVHSASFQQADFLQDHRPGAGPARVFVCLDDDSLSLSAALALLRRGRIHNPTIVVRMAQDAGLAKLLDNADTGDSSFRHLRAFGLLDRTCHPDQMLRGTHEILACAIHDDYLRQQAAAGVKPEQNSSMVPWHALPEHLQESNRRQADDIGAKLRAVHCSAAPLLDWDESLFEFKKEEIERLARMEHDRWMAENQQAGWRHGPKRDSEAKTHPCLVPFDELPPDEQDKDRHAVRQIPATLAKVGFRVHRLKPRPQGSDEDASKP